MDPKKLANKQNKPFNTGAKTKHPVGKKTAKKGAAPKIKKPGGA